MEDCSELVASVRAGDLKAFGVLYDKYGRLVRAICYDRVNHQADAEDLAQEVFLRAFRKLDQLKQADQFGYWLVGIARRMSIDWQRRGMMQSSLSMEPFVDHPDKVTDESLASQLEELRFLISQLPEREQLAIHTFYLTEKPASVAQDVLKLSTSGFYKLLERARKMLAMKMSSKEGLKQ